jgi:hypothetical protein
MATTKKPAAKKTAAKKAAPKGKNLLHAAAPKAPAVVTVTTWEKFKALDNALELLCERIHSGAMLTEISRGLECSFGTLSAWIAADPDRSARVREARIASAAAYEEQALEGIQGAKDAFSLAKAKEMAHHLRWKASKLNPKDFGDKVEIDHRGSLAALSDEQVVTQLGTLLAKAGLTGGPVEAPAG